MNRSVTKFASSLIALGAVLAGTPAHALSTKTYVSGTGSDANNCSTIPLACATFAHALTQTAAGGEITVVNTGNYGTVEIGKSVNITNDGAGEASIVGFGATNGISLVAGPGDVVSVRGLVIDGQGGSAVGIGVETASAVHVQNCVMRNLEFPGSGAGIFVTALNNFQMFVSDTTIYNNGSSAATGGIILKALFASTANVVLDRVHLENNVVGLLVDARFGSTDGVHVVIRDSVVSGNASDGILATSAAGQPPAFILVERTSIVNNGGVGIHADGPRATMLLKDNTITRNGAGMSATNSGQLISYGNNTNNNNLGPEGAPTGFLSQM